MKVILTCIFSFLIVGTTFSQYNDYIGAGHNDNIVITSSSNNGNASAQKTMDGSGFLAERYEASRFLSQATLGFDETDIDEVLSNGMESWINDQIAIPKSEILPVMNSIWDEIYAAEVAYGTNPDDLFGPTDIHFNYAWWQNLMTKDDKLRQRVALALSEIFVVSNESNIGSYGWASSYYFDRFLTDAFGNYRDILSGVSLDPNMGVYLSHLNNPKTDTTENIHPDENYAREIMQLFSIGLYKLNMDGSRQVDSNGDEIPTYDNTDIKGMAKVFTGFGAGDIEDYVDWVTEPYFNLGYWGTNKKVQMQMYDAEHEPGEKHIFDGHIVPDGQTGMEDYEMTIDLLFDHQNVPPFICRRLIQRLIKSTPSPAYIERVANVFVDNGSGERGNLEDVIKAILLDEEARDESYMDIPSTGKLREPIVRYTNLVKAIPNDSPSGRYWNNGFNYKDEMGQYPMFAPSVFNFFLPDYQPNGEVVDNDWFAPEFQIHNTKTILNYYDYMYSMNIWDYALYSWENENIIDTDVSFNTTDLESYWDQPEVLMNKLDMLFTHGTLSDRTKDFIKDAIVSVNANTYMEQYEDMTIPRARIRLALYLMMVSPDYAIRK